MRFASTNKGLPRGYSGDLSGAQWGLKGGGDGGDVAVLFSIGASSWGLWGLITTMSTKLTSSPLHLSFSLFSFSFFYTYILSTNN